MGRFLSSQISARELPLGSFTSISLSVNSYAQDARKEARIFGLIKIAGVGSIQKESVFPVLYRRYKHCRGAKHLRTGVCMGPHILLDKSVIQSLSFDDIDFLNRYYYLNIPSVLIMEILGDLKKPSKEGEGVTKEKVKYLANKISRQSSAFNADYRNLVLGDLLGHKIKMDRRPVLLGGRAVKGKSGEKGIVFDVSPEEELINKWKVGDFSTEDSVTSQNW